MIIHYNILVDVTFTQFVLKRQYSYQSIALNKTKRENIYDSCERAAGLNASNVSRVAQNDKKKIMVKAF